MQYYLAVVKRRSCRKPTRWKVLRMKILMPLKSVNWRLVFLFFMSALGSIGWHSPRASAAHPYRGGIAWSIVLCRFSDSPAPPHDAAYYRDLIVNRGTGGLSDFIATVAYGNADLTPSVVKGWYTEPFTRAQEDALGGGGSPTRTRKFQDCLDAAARDPTDPYTPPPGQLVAVITSPGIDLFGMIGVGSFLPDNVDMVGMSHEVGHGLGFSHSFSDNTINAEYDDPWDMMSAYNVFADPRPGARFGNAGPGFNAPHVDAMGWLPRPRIFTAGADGAPSSTVTLAALNHPEASGFLIARIPFDPGDPFHYYTAEFRRDDGFDGGLPASSVLIHEVNLDASQGVYHTYLLRQNSAPDRPPAQMLNANGVTIAVNSVSEATNQAQITIGSQIADRCLVGFVWREASPADHVCVTVAIRSQTAADNAQAAARRQPGGGPFGPDTCRQGFVWREAFANDHVCVTPPTRAQAAADNGQAANRRNPARFVFGPNTCASGFVWREADNSDFVCVSAAERGTVRGENANLALHRNPGGGPFGPDTCASGFVWREAFPNDHVCVTPVRRTQARADNGQANARLMKQNIQ
jgi:hypothetical protein